jgi:hypothetical protein
LRRPQRVRAFAARGGVRIDGWRSRRCAPAPVREAHQLGRVAERPECAQDLLDVDPLRILPGRPMVIENVHRRP